MKAPCRCHTSPDDGGHNGQHCRRLVLPSLSDSARPAAPCDGTIIGATSSRPHDLRKRFDEGRSPTGRWTFSVPPEGFGPWLFASDALHQHRLGAEVLGHRFTRLRDQAGPGSDTAPLPPHGGDQAGARRQDPRRSSTARARRRCHHAARVLLRPARHRHRGRRPHRRLPRPLPQRPA